MSCMALILGNDFWLILLWLQPVFERRMRLSKENPEFCAINYYIYFLIKIKCWHDNLNDIIGLNLSTGKDLMRWHGSLLV